MYRMRRLGSIPFEAFDTRAIGVASSGHGIWRCRLVDLGRQAVDHLYRLGEIETSCHRSGRALAAVEIRCG